MKFRLTYDGLLLGATQKNPRAAHKHEIRKAFHPQLRELWRMNPSLHGVWQSIKDKYDGVKLDTIKKFSEQFATADYNFLPLVTRNDKVSVSIDVLFLRPGPIGVLLQSGDLDNRLSTLFDALQIVKDVQTFGKSYVPPDESERPFFCLLEDDKLISKVSVETDSLLQAIPGVEPKENHARVVMTVEVRSLHAGGSRFA